jgi:YD repeat-containing protein
VLDGSDSSGNSFLGDYFDQTKLFHDVADHEYIATDEMGDKVTFYDYSNSVPPRAQGQFKSYTDPAGNITHVTSTNGDGLPTEIQRTATSGTTTVTESYVYIYSTAVDSIDPILVEVLERRMIGGGSWASVQMVAYTYDSYNNLISAAIENGSGYVEDMYFYRYSSEGSANDLEYALSPASYARAVAALGDVYGASDAALAPYADNAFTYDGDNRVSTEVVQGAGCSVCSAGMGTYSYSYILGGIGYGDPNLTVETLPDGNTNSVLTNGAAQITEFDFEDVSTSQVWETFYTYNSVFQLIQKTDPSGLITIYDYGTSGAPGYLQDIKIKQNGSSSAILQESFLYDTHTVSGATVHPLSSDTVYRDTAGGGAETTSYSYTYFSSLLQIQSMTVTKATISSAENGPGTADTSVTFYDPYGEPIWTKDGDGFLNYTAYDIATGAVTKTISDVDTGFTASFSNLPSGWTTPSGGGLQLVTLYQVDSLGRTIKETSPAGNVTYTIYDDLNHEKRLYPGWNSTTGTPTGPTIVYREDRGSSTGYSEVLTMTATPSLTGGAPNGTEAISNLQSLSRSYVNAAGQATRTDVYFQLTGVTYSTALYIGSVNANYFTTLYAFDSRGRLARTLTPTGTITRQVFDGQGRLLSTWVGTNDAPASGYWSPTNNTSPSNMVEITANVYDGGGIGDGNLTQVTKYPGGSLPNQVTQYYYDWRDRLVATKAGMQSS